MKIKIIIASFILLSFGLAQAAAPTPTPEARAELKASSPEKIAAKPAFAQSVADD